jgi:FtsK/SpoIIIE family
LVEEVTVAVATAVRLAALQVTAATGRQPEVPGAVTSSAPVGTAGWPGPFELVRQHPRAVTLLLVTLAVMAGWRWLRHKAATERHRELPSLPRTVWRLARLVTLEERRIWRIGYAAGQLAWELVTRLGPPGTSLRLQLVVVALLLGRSAYVFRRRGRVFGEMFQLAADKCKYPRTTRSKRGAELQRHKYVRMHRWQHTDKVGLHTVVVSPEMDKGLGRIREDFEREWTHTVPKVPGQCFKYVWLTNKRSTARSHRKARLPRVRAIPVADIPDRAPWPGPMTTPPVIPWRDPAPLGEELLAYVDALRKGHFEDGTPVWPLSDLWRRARHGTYLFPVEDLWRKFALGVTIGGQVVIWDPIDCPHMLIGGPNNTGKSNLERLLILQALAHPDQWRVIGFDPLAVELNWLEGLPGVELVATTLEDIAGGFQRILRELAKRQTLCEAAGVNNFLKLKNPPPALLVVIDEVTELLAQEGAKDEEGKAEDQLRGWMSRKLAVIARTGRKYGVYLVVATQRPDVALGFLGNMKAQLHARLATAYMDTTASRMVLDNTRATELPPSDEFPGRHLAQFDSRWVELQGFWVDHADAMRFVGPPSDSGRFPGEDDRPASTGRPVQPDLAAATATAEAELEGEQPTNGEAPAAAAARKPTAAGARPATDGQPAGEHPPDELAERRRKRLVKGG